MDMTVITVKRRPVSAVLEVVFQSATGHLRKKQKVRYPNELVPFKFIKKGFFFCFLGFIFFFFVFFCFFLGLGVC